MVQIQGNYFEKLRQAKPTRIKYITKPLPGSASAPRIVVHDIPPLNTDIDLTILPEYVQVRHIGAHALKTEKELPETWDWRHSYPHDTREMRRKKTLMSKVPNQALCGSCWAVSGASVVSDNFVVSDIVKYDPQLSATYALSCYPQYQCGGGNPAQLMIDISEHGIGDKRCTDYSWCLENKKCNGSALKHFTTQGLNNIIPKCGCYDANKEHYIYYTKNPERISIQDDSLQADFTLKIKNHIYLKGPVTGTYLVYSNFVSGDFTKTGGVYLENVQYDGGNVTYGEKGQIMGQYKGSHAVAIIGWGVAKQIVIDKNGTRADVPYWYVRNSWKSSWGVDDGYFKMAMYPWNKTAQFDKQIIITDNSNNHILGGGMMTITADRVEQAKMKDNNYKGKLLEDKDFYDKLPKAQPFKDDGDYGDNSDEKKKKQSYRTLLIIIGIIILVFLLVLGGFFIYKKNKKVNYSSHPSLAPSKTFF